MEKIKSASRWCLTSILIPAIMYIFIQTDDVVNALFHKGVISDPGLGSWRIFILVVLALSIMWLASRALVPKSGDALSLAVGLVLTAAVVWSVHIFPIVVDMLMLPTLLACFYLCALVVCLAGRAMA